MPKPGEVAGILSSVSFWFSACTCGVPYSVIDTAPCCFWRSYASTAGGTLYSLSISGATIL